MNYFYAPHIADGADFLDEEESAHAIKVLRHKESDKIGLLDGKGGKYLAVIKQANPKKLQFEIVNTEISRQLPYSIHIAIAPTKNADRMEWMVEKLAEIGLDEISLFFSQNSERRKYRLDRLEKKLLGAIKQSKNPFLPILNEPVSFEQIIDSSAENQRFIAFVDHNNPQLLSKLIQKESSILVVIGPEGDFTTNEVDYALEKGFNKISLGKNVLRTETAGIVACHTIHLINS